MANPQPIVAAPRSHVARAPLRFPPRRSRPEGIQRAACTACQKRKTKCDGLRPRCSACTVKETPCEYKVAEGQTRVGAMKARNEELESQLAISREIIRALRTAPMPEAAQLFERLRSGADLAEIIDSGQHNNQQAPGQISGSDATEQNINITENKGLIWANPSLGSAKDQEVAASSRSSSNQQVGFEYDCSLATPLDILKSPACFDAYNLFIDCVGVLFYVYTQDQVKSVFEIFLRRPPEHVPTSLLCEAFAIAAVGSLYSHDTIPPDIGITFYNMAKWFLNDLVKIDPLRAMKVCVLLAAYNIVTKETVALSFIDMGLNLGRSQSIHREQVPDSLTAAAWIDYKRTWRTLICFKGWLVATLGFVPWNEWTDDIIWSTVDPSLENITIQETIQIHLTKIAIIEAKMFRQIFALSDLRREHVDEARANLHQWYQDLPPSIKLAALSESPLANGPKVGVYLTHFIHLGAMIMLQRRILQHYIQTAEANLTLAKERITELSDAFEDGFVAALQTSRMLDLLMDEEAVFQRCWMCM
ncbi:uncharacterized protein K452DRAFT_45261 [Aplosporella prunicola CBS 121167]|uniref:Zn(2)-C6 fungal-type domain-containing protein n=1 Tax=Aplosporella prunicola CBS 121167 TaxID=1176127 RepID=A0A6A6BCU4_9PEZI|nr:uncharacterized protein K452DRAFT_45261 [Aplosporella prunicola CBS 121167]KAF2141105.1 hypothetical protein K452DRAFT_45261 [Aplosporella prunicola CBS 121167]